MKKFLIIPLILIKIPLFLILSKILQSNKFLFQLFKSLQHHKISKSLINKIKNFLIPNNSPNNFQVIKILKDKKKKSLKVNQFQMTRKSLKNIPKIKLLKKIFIFVVRNVKQHINIVIKLVSVLFQEDKEELNYPRRVAEYVGVKDVQKKIENILMLNKIKKRKR